VRLNEQTGDRYGAADTWDTLGRAHLGPGHVAESLDCYRQAADHYRELGNRWAEADTVTRIGDAHAAAGSTAAAHEAWRRAVAVLEELGHPDVDAVRAKLLGGVDTPQPS
jgi:predicted TPR repeat methyltransferase